MFVKTANTSQPVLEAIANRWSPRAFSDKPVEPEKIVKLLEAARWAPSSFNEQPWRFIIGRKDNPEAYEKVLSCLFDGNQTWAKSAPVLIMAVAKMKFARNEKPNRHGPYDTGQAMANLTIQATALDLYAHQMAGFDAQKAREVFDIPEDYDPMAVAAIGYLGDPSQLSEQMRQAEESPRERKALPEIVYSGTWGQASDLV